MKRLQIVLSAIHFAEANYQNPDGLAMSKSMNAAFEAENLNPADYDLWVQSAQRHMQMFRSLADQSAPSATVARQAPAPPAAVASPAPAAAAQNEQPAPPTT